jgi:pimeloyl-ACP methyl ester carboxylesterase
MKKWELLKKYDFHGQSIRYGNVGEGPALILVHGTPWSSYNFRHIIKELSKKYSVYYYDLLGYGLSEKSEGDVSLNIQNQVLDELINHWKLEKPSIVGHDFGGATILRNHLLNKREFEKIVLIDPVAISPWGSPFFLHVRDHEAAFAGVPDYIHEAIVHAYISTAAFKKIEPETMKATLSPWLTPEGKPAFYRQIAQANSKFTEEVQVLYENISIPVLILWGEEDTWIPIERGRKLQKLIPKSQFQAISQAGHLVIEEKPKELAKEILNYLKQ